VSGLEVSEEHLEGWGVEGWDFQGDSQVVRDGEVDAG